MVLGKLSGNGAAYRTGTDDNNIRFEQVYHLIKYFMNLRKNFAKPVKGSYKVIVMPFLDFVNIFPKILQYRERKDKAAQKTGNIYANFLR
jgi:hypothetical protein